VTDASGNQLPGVPVTFTASAGILSSNAAVTNENGDARVTLTTSRDTTVTANAGGKEATVTIRANTAPTVTVSATTQTPTALQPVTFTVNVTAGSSPIRAVTIDFGDGTSQALGSLTGSSSVSHTYRAGGTYTVTAAVLDNSGEGTSVSTVVEVRPPTPINVTLSSTTSSPTVGTPVNFDANVTPATVTITRYEWDFGDGQSTVTSGDTTSHIYTSAGRRTVSVTAVSSEGLTGSARLEINVAPEPPINVTISFTPSAPTANTTVTFTAAVTPTTTQVVRYEWVFGDGSTAVTSGQTVHHVYATAGVKQVSVRIVAADGRTASAVAEIRVN
jgi:PKD repeat protein